MGASPRRPAAGVRIAETGSGEQWHQRGQPAQRVPAALRSGGQESRRLRRGRSHHAQRRYEKLSLPSMSLIYKFIQLRPFIICIYYTFHVHGSLLLDCFLLYGIAFFFFPWFFFYSVLRPPVERKRPQFPNGSWRPTTYRGTRSSRSAATRCARCSARATTCRPARTRAARTWPSSSAIFRPTCRRGSTKTSSSTS